MKRVLIGAHLRREDIEPLATPIAAGAIFASAMLVADDQPLSDRGLLVNISKVRAALLDRATFVAIRYGFAALTDEEVAAKCAAHTHRWRDLLERYRDHVELTLKVGVAAPSKRPDRHDFTSGAEYLRALHAVREAADVDDAFRADAEKMFATATKKRWMHRDESSVELAALLPRKSAEACFTAAGALKERFPHVPFLLSGPWPLEVFTDADDQ
jgi:hypothetical protein